VRSNIRIK